MAASDITMPDGKYLADIVANLNVFASDPGTSRGAGEIIYQSTAGVLKVNTGTAGSPVWTAVGSSTNILGTDAPTFTINQDNAGAESSAIAFDRGSEATSARILWSETNDRFSFDSVAGVTLADIRAKNIQTDGGKIYLYKAATDAASMYIMRDSTSGNMIFHVPTGEAVEWQVG